MTTDKKSLTPKQAYKTMLTEYPDVLEICHVCEILKINRKTAYKLFENNKLSCVRIGRKYRIAKIDLIKYLLGN